MSSQDEILEVMIRSDLGTIRKELGRMRKQAGIPETIVFHSLRNTFATRMENLGVPKNHISQLLGHEDGNMALDVYSGGLAIEPLRESIGKLIYEDKICEIIEKCKY
jgi:Site-specific recombinase XerD